MGRAIFLLAMVTALVSVSAFYGYTAVVSVGALLATRGASALLLPFRLYRDAFLTQKVRRRSPRSARAAALGSRPLPRVSPRDTRARDTRAPPPPERAPPPSRRPARKKSGVARALTARADQP